MNRSYQFATYSKVFCYVVGPSQLAFPTLRVFYFKGFFDFESLKPLNI